MTILEKLEIKLLEAQERKRRVDEEIQNITVAIESLRNVDANALSFLLSRTVSEILTYIALSKNGITHGVISTKEATHMLTAAGYFSSVRNAQTTISSVLSRNKSWKRIHRGVWKYNES